MKTITLLALSFVLTSSGFASREGILPLSSFHVESDGIGSSGKIVVEGRQDKNAEITALKISAFGKDYLVPKEKLAKLAELPANGIRISFAQGYAELGGRTVYIQLQMGFTSSTKKEALVTLTEDGKIEISEIEMLSEPAKAK